MLSIDKLEQLPKFHQATISGEYIDPMGHMNIRWYMALFDTAGWNFFASFGMTQEYYDRNQAGGFALMHFIRYLAEVRQDEIISVRTRIIGRSEKRLHYVHFMINETTQKLASTLEALGAHADLRIRRTTAYPPELTAAIDAKIAEYKELDWEAPLSGCIKP